MDKELIELTVDIHHETESAWLVSDDGNKETAVWIPKSQCEFEDGVLHCPEWLAFDKGLI